MPAALPRATGQTARAVPRTQAEGTRRAWSSCRPSRARSCRRCLGRLTRTGSGGTAGYTLIAGSTLSAPRSGSCTHHMDCHCLPLSAPLIPLDALRRASNTTASKPRHPPARRSSASMGSSAARRRPHLHRRHSTAGRRRRQRVSRTRRRRTSMPESPLWMCNERGLTWRHAPCDAATRSSSLYFGHAASSDVLGDCAHGTWLKAARMRVQRQQRDHEA
mmetsp:Transcript_24591/g.49294  ORF Transcript_24591/g.49294 Transcript_24591/m.49294 type:complete len:219 (+) Transcript_24591:717-1373(+)